MATHRPYVDTAKKEANTGSWVDDPQHPPPENNTYKNNTYKNNTYKKNTYKKNTYITIEEDGTVTLEEYMG
jgi:hypothetical protein